jgi:hypothetical protein
VRLPSIQTHLLAFFSVQFARGVRLMRDATGTIGELRRQRWSQGIPTT